MIWIEPEHVHVPPELQNAVGGHPLVAETLVRRGIIAPAKAQSFLDPGSYAPASPTDLPDLGQTVERLRRAIKQAEPIAVWGDFDADGQTATALLFETLHSAGADVRYHVPKRQEGHGLHTAGLERLIAQGARVILTCDTGVTAHTQVDFARQLGADVLITDHHVPGKSLPPALAVVNPHRLPAGHPMATLPGVGVAYQLARALGTPESGSPQDPTAADSVLDLVALGTVADVATLTGDTRFLVQRGLEALRSTKRSGLLAIYAAADLRPDGITEEHVGFVLGPRLNALGRLDDAAKGVELLTTNDLMRARTLAAEVEGLNARRQWLTRQVLEAALTQVEREPALLRDFEALVLSYPTWPSGVVGIVAGRLAERFDKPVVMISAPEAEVARGSARSVPGVDIIAALTECDYLLEGYGGHAGAAGFGIDAVKIPDLRAALSRAVAQQADARPEASLSVDAYVDLQDLSLDLVAEINRLAPFGPGNPPLTLAVRNVELSSEATIGRTGEHRRLTIQDVQDRTHTVFWWHGADWPLPRGRFDLAFTVRTSDYRGTAQVQVDWLDARELAPTKPWSPAQPAITVIDRRTVKDPHVALLALAREGDVQIWAEVSAPDGIESHNRRQLVPSHCLVIWTVPPGPRELQAALEKASPEEVVLFAQIPGLDQPNTFLARLAGLVKYALRTKEGALSIEEAAIATAHRAATVRAGLEWLAARGQVAILGRQDDHWRLEAGQGGPDPQASELALSQLNAMLDETGAFRTYYLHAPAADLARRAGTGSDPLSTRRQPG